jgi:tRNA(fMet)-specific endonuclease VapC
MIYLIDSDWVIDFLRGRPSAVALLEDFPIGDIGISIITYGEVYEGIAFGPQQRINEDALNEFLRVADVVQLTRPIMRRYARIRGELRRVGRRLEDTDLLIAATALQHDLTLVTRNVNHFARVPGLRLYQIP